MAVRAIVAVKRIVTNSQDNSRVDVVITGCVIGPQAALLNINGTFEFDIGSINPDLSAAQMQSGLTSAVKSFLEATYGVTFLGSDTVRTLTSIS